MSQTPSTAGPSSRFRFILDKALEAYTKKTGKNLLSLPLFHDLDACDSPEAVLEKLRDQIPAFDRPGGSDDGLTKWLTPTVNVLYAFSATLGEGVGLVFSPAKAVFAGIGVLLLAAKDVAASQDTLVDLLERVANFLRRLEIYPEFPPTAAMTDIIVTIMVEVLSVLAIATSDIKQSRTKKFLKRLAGRTDIEDALCRLDKLTQDEVRMAVAQDLKATHHVDYRVGCVHEKVDRVLDVGEKSEATLQQIASDVGDKNRNELRQKLRQWLSPPDPSVNYNTACDLHHKGTAAWFTQGPMFAGWQKSGSLLWIYGLPGSGKSVLSSAIIRNIEVVANTGLAYMAYFFFDFKDAGKQDTRALLSSLVYQLCNQSGSYFDILLRLYSAHHDGSRQPSNDALKKCLKDMLAIPGQVPIYLVFDALDECPDTHGVPSSRRRVLDFVKELVELQHPNLRLCVTSRSEMDVRTVLEPLTRTSLSLHNQKGQNKDIVDYISSVVYSDPELNMRGWREEDKKLVITTLSNRAGGMFRWVHCQLEILRRCFARNLRQTLDELPETLDATYERILREIPKQNSDDAHRLLQCLTVAVHPLDVEGLAEVLAVDFTAGEIPKLNVDSRWEDQEQAVLLACSSLVVVVEHDGSRVVQFSHFSVKEFLTSDRLAAAKGNILRYHIRLEHAHKVMAQVCLAVVFQLDYSIDEGVFETFPLAGYAVNHLSKHVEFENVLTLLQDELDYLFDTEKPHFAAWVFCVRRSYPYSLAQFAEGWEKIRTRSPERPETVPLYYVAEFGFRGLVRHIISKRPQDVNARGGPYGTPLHAASCRGQVKVSQLLLPHCTDVDVRGIGDQTPLHLASYKGYVDIGQQLLDHNADVNARQGDGKTPLHLALLGGPAQSVKMLVQPSLFASERIFCDIMRLLLDKGAAVDAQDNDHITPLHLASSQGKVEAAQLLLEYGANIQVQDNQGRTPLHNASWDGHHDTLRLLLDRGADVDVQDDSHSTPLHLTFSHWAAQLLLEYGANVQVQDNRGRTPLHYISWCGNPNTMRLLLDRGADVDAQDDDHSTPLHLVSFHLVPSQRGQVEAARLLLEYGANVQAQDDQGRTPLHYASLFGDYDTMRLFLDQGADVAAQDENHATPLHLLSSRLKPIAATLVEEVTYVGEQTRRAALAMRLLVERGANVHVRNRNGQTPLHCILGHVGDQFDNSFFDAVGLLLEHNVDVDAQDNDYTTPLHVASFYGSLKAASLLLQHGANVHVQNKKGETPFQVAMARGHQEVMELLSELGRSLP